MHHFDLLDLRLWKQRYCAGRLDHFKVGGPILFVPGGEAPMESLLYRSFGERLARTFGGVHYALEHRFYGASMPLGTAEASFERSPAALGKLTVGQAVADAAAFLRFLKQQVHPSAGKVSLLLFCFLQLALSISVLQVLLQLLYLTAKALTNDVHL